MENNYSKYFKYAIGEIILVVVGILIALQINNWNEERKNRIFETEILQQIRANLMKDKLTLEDINTNFKNSLSSSSKILNSDWNEQDQDSLKNWLGDIIQFDRFQPLTNAYEVAKSKGLELISNKQLRFLLGTYYDDEANDVQLAIQDIQRSFNRDWIPILQQRIVDFRFKSFLTIDEPLIFSSPSRERNILKLNRDNFRGSSEGVTHVIKTIDRIQELINQELNSR